MSGGHIARCSVLLENIVGSLPEIDAEINKYSTKWKTTRMPKVDLAIMRLAVGEMKFSDDIPHAVVINEAINLAKKYSTDQSARFIHGVLGAVSKTYTGN
jgi:N utilization substance protein B